MSVYRFFFISFIAILACGFSPVQATSHHASFSWKTAIIKMETTSKTYSEVQPWAEQQLQGLKFGTVLADHMILTTAEGLENNVEIRLQKGGSGLYSSGRIAWIDYQTNLALITTDEADFWTGLTPATLATTIPSSGEVHILRWSDVDLEDRRGQIDRIHVVNSDLSSVSVPALRVNDTNIQSAGLGEPIALGDQLIGMGNAQEGDAVDAIPSYFIANILTDRKANKYTGIGYFDFTWDAVQNPLDLFYLKLPPPARGVIVRQTNLKPGFNEPIQPRDIITQIDGFDIDAEGNYEDPAYGKLSLENLSCRNKWSGQVVHMQVWRDGKEMNIDYPLPKAEFADNLVPSQTFDQPVYYAVVAGLVFTPLTDAYLRNWGTSWQTSYPLEFEPFVDGKKTADRPERVVLSQVLPAEINITYEAARNEIVDKVNGIPVKDLTDLVSAFHKPVNGFDVIDFESGVGIHRVVLPADQIVNATLDIANRYHVARTIVLPGDLPQ